MKLKYPANFYLSSGIIIFLLLVGFGIGLQLAYEASIKDDIIEFIAGSIILALTCVCIFPAIDIIKRSKKVYGKLMEALGSKELANAAIFLFNEAKQLKKMYPDRFQDIAYTIVELVEQGVGS